MILPPPQLEESWKRALQHEWQKPYLARLAQFVAEQRKLGAVYPPKDAVFAAFSYTPYDSVKVVIMGQDPYHGPGQACGLSFSVPHGISPPPSLKNIYKELQDDLGIPPPNHGCLDKWAKQGVLLLNASLTVRAKEPSSHANKGWETFTDAVIEALSQRSHPVIFVLWGKAAQQKCDRILGCATQRHFILTAPHPSPYSAHSGFLGCRHFSKINDLLKKRKEKNLSIGAYKW